ncbi:MAG: DUF4143 domain-containing protein [bacterium]|nr:DUF4143 domain-containing protein [bacterium]
MDYLRRTIDLELDELLPLAPAIAIDGPKGVGKTGTAVRRAATTWFLDRPAQQEVARADFDFSSVGPGTLLLDEWQRVPQVWDAVRRQVDDGALPGRFLLTGSASPSDPSGTHSGAGRILSLRMRPMALHERGGVVPTVSMSHLLEGTAAPVGGSSNLELAQYVDAIVSSGFPAISAAAPRLRRGLLDSYVQAVIDRDLPELGFGVRRPEVLKRWLAAYAAASSTTTSYSRILDATTGGDGTQPATTTTIAYRDHLTKLWLLDPVPGWIPANNPIRRLQQAPKHQLADPALAVSLLGLTAPRLVGGSGAHMAGPLFESLATLGVRVMAQASEARVYHLRMSGGDREVDLIVEGPEGQILALEVKLAPSVTDHDVRHLRWLRDQIPERVADLAVITTGTHAYRRRDGVAVIPLALLGP